MVAKFRSVRSFLELGVGDGNTLVARRTNHLCICAGAPRRDRMLVVEWPGSSLFNQSFAAGPFVFNYHVVNDNTCIYDVDEGLHNLRTNQRFDNRESCL